MITRFAAVVALLALAACSPSMTGSKLRNADGEYGPPTNTGSMSELGVSCRSNGKTGGAGVDCPNVSP